VGLDLGGMQARAWAEPCPALPHAAYSCHALRVGQSAAPSALAQASSAMCSRFGWVQARPWAGRLGIRAGSSFGQHWALASRSGAERRALAGEFLVCDAHTAVTHGAIAHAARLLLGPAPARIYP